MKLSNYSLEIDSSDYTGRAGQKKENRNSNMRNQLFWAKLTVLNGFSFLEIVCILTFLICCFKYSWFTLIAHVHKPSRIRGPAVVKTKRKIDHFFPEVFFPRFFRIFYIDYQVICKNRQSYFLAQSVYLLSFLVLFQQVGLLRTTLKKTAEKK